MRTQSTFSLAFLLALIGIVLHSNLTVQAQLNSSSADGSSSASSASSDMGDSSQAGGATVAADKIHYNSKSLTTYGAGGAVFTTDSKGPYSNAQKLCEKRTGFGIATIPAIEQIISENESSKQQFVNRLRLENTDAMLSGDRYVWVSRKMLNGAKLDCPLMDLLTLQPSKDACNLTMPYLALCFGDNPRPAVLGGV